MPPGRTSHHILFYLINLTFKILHALPRAVKKSYAGSDKKAELIEEDLYFYFKSAGVHFLRPDTMIFNPVRCSCFGGDMKSMHQLKNMKRKLS